MSEKKRGPILLHNVLFMLLNPLAALIFTPIYFMNHSLTWGLVAFLAITYTISNMVITVGYHRYFSHRSFNAHPIVEFLFVLVGAGSFQGSVLQWCSDHRRHHREVDTDADPYSINKGFMFAHIFWMFFKDPHPEAGIYPKDLMKSKAIVFQHKYYAWIAAFMGFILPGIIAHFLGFGFWGGVIIGGSLRIFLSQQSTFLINSAAHTFGKRPYTDKNTARDSFILAFLTFGEGYHNFHHFFQADYRNGVRWYQWDPTKWFIRSLSFVGLTTKLKRARKEEIFKARISMDEKLLVQKGACIDRTAQLKARMVEAQAKIKQLGDDYHAAVASFREKRKLMTEEMREQMRTQLQKLKRTKKVELRLAKTEFAVAYTQWREFRREPHKAAA
ncbi:MAG TPA: fatty acid desaturase [Bdellovibrionales bacterium]|jgi:stearoyl-CoA desaturase (delta-9 desaturase)|nr:fatty acid desaturase [Bdellovibrionales bacterium]